MENKSLIQEQSNNRIEYRENTLKAIKDNLNYIYIFIMIIANCLISLLKVDENGTIGLRYPTTGLGWTLWITQILTITFIGVMILNSFRRQGIKNGHKIIKPVYDEYIEAITSLDKDSNPRGLEEYLKYNLLKDSIVKGSMLIAINILVVSAVISANVNSLFALVVNIIFAVSFGIKALLEAEDYVITELVIWYKKKIKQLKMKKEKKNEK